MQKNSIIGLELTTSQSALWYLGQEGFIIGNNGKYIAVDPYLSDYVDQNCCQYVQWERLYAPPIEASELDFLDADAVFAENYIDITADAPVKISFSVTGGLETAYHLTNSLRMRSVYDLNG